MLWGFLGDRTEKGGGKGKEGRARVEEERNTTVSCFLFGGEILR